MPTDNRPTAQNQFVQKQLTGKGPRGPRNQFWHDLLSYGAGIFDNKPDYPGQGQARQKVLTMPLELIAPTRIVKVLAELVAGSDLPPGVHREAGGRGTGAAEREELDRIAAERAKAHADAEERKRGQTPGAAPTRPSPANTPNVPRSIVLGAASVGIRYALKSHASDGRAVQLAALARRVIGPLQGSGDLAKAKIGHAVVSRLGLLGRRALRPPGSAVLGAGVNATADAIDVSALVNVDGLDP